MTTEQKTGRLIILVYITVTLAVSLGVIGLYVFTRGTGRLPAQVVRFSLSVALSFWLYQGSAAAKWTMVVLLGLGGAAGLLGVFSGNLAGAALGLGMAAIYLSFAVVMVASSSVKAFLTHQRTLAEREVHSQMDQKAAEDWRKQ